MATILFSSRKLPPPPIGGGNWQLLAKNTIRCAGLSWASFRRDHLAWWGAKHFMAIMNESKLEINESGQKYLICWYDHELCNWDEVIKAALNRHKLGNKVPILCLPKKEATDG
jgi:hypothetical protein